MVHFSRMKNHLHFIPGMNSGPNESNGGAKRGLLALLHYLWTSTTLVASRACLPAEPALAALCFLPKASFKQCPF
jgi:hypothetical protein